MSISKEVRSFIRELSSILEENPVKTEVSSSPPQELHLELTYKCDSSCVMCNLGKLIQKQAGPDITLNEIKNLIQNSALLEDMKYVILSGGEPWLHPEFSDIAVYLKKRFSRADILILSNLMNSSAILKNLRKIGDEAGLDRISIGTSIDGVGEAHDRIRGVKGAFNSTVATALLIKKEFPKLFPTFNFTLQPENAEEIPGVYRWSRKLGAHVSYQVIVPKKELGEVEWSSDTIKKIDESIDRVIDIIWDEEGYEGFEPSQIFDNLSLMFFLLNFEYISRFIKNPQRYYFNCPCGEKYAMLSPSGDLYFCPVHKDMIAGRIREEDFDLIWQGNTAAKIRGFFNSYICRCWLSCTNDAMLSENFFLRKDEIIRRLSGK